MGGIRVSEKYGVNPSMEQCFYCGEDVGIVLFGAMSGARAAAMGGGRDGEAPRRVCFGTHSEPCPKCKGWMEKGVMLVSVRDGQDESEQNPYRSGRMAVVSEDGVRAVFDPESADKLCASRFGFIENSAWEKVGLPMDSDELVEAIGAAAE